MILTVNLLLSGDGTKSISQVRTFGVTIKHYPHGVVATTNAVSSLLLPAYAQRSIRGGLHMQ